MTVYRYEPDAPFEECYRTTRSPRQVVEHELDAQNAEQFLASGSSPFNLVRGLAMDNDISSLQVFLKEPFVEKVKKSAAYSSDPMHSLPYCVAHMLIDNSGNDDFARQWMQTYGHTRELAAAYYLELWKGETHQSLGMVQRRLGVATVADVFQEGLGKNALAPFHEAMATTKPDAEDIVQKAREGAFVLRTCHPDELPMMAMAQKTGPHQMQLYSDHLWASSHRKLHHMLDAVGLAYDESNQAVRQQMQSSIDRMLASSDFLVQHSHTFDALKKWGKEGYGRDMWRLSREGWGFVEEIISWEQPRALEHLQQLIAAGADVNAPSRPGVSNQGDLWRAIDAAVHHAKPGAVGFLLGQGCDPDIPAKSQDPKEAISAAERAIRMDIEEPGSAVRPKADIQAVASIMRVHLAKTAALAVIDELEMAAPAGRRP